MQTPITVYSVNSCQTLKLVLRDLALKPAAATLVTVVSGIPKFLAKALVGICVYVW